MSVATWRASENAVVDAHPLQHNTLLDIQVNGDKNLTMHTFQLVHEDVPRSECHAVLEQAYLCRLKLCKLEARTLPLRRLKQNISTEASQAEFSMVKYI